jgi:hypothetical protein
MNVIELRNYLLNPGKKDEFIQYFKDHFVHSQNDMGVHIPRLFRIKNEHNRFFWIRGFDNMEHRSRFLPAFYGGDVWEKFGPAANDMMLEWHDVYLAKPLLDNQNAFPQNKGFFVIDCYKAKDGGHLNLVDLFTNEYIPFLHQQGIKDITLWVSEMEENDFPRLPVYQDINLLIVVAGFTNETEYESTVAQHNVFNKSFNANMEKLVENKSSLLLYPA